jgi:thiol:disulfide interchange protein DsbA
MKKIWLFLPLMLLAAGAALGDARNYQQGINYEAVNPAMPTDVKPGQIEVVEFFWYGCPHCYGLQPFVRGWDANKPKDVVFKLVPEAFPNSEFYTDAQAYYTAQVLGINDKIHEKFFNAIHQEGHPELRDDVNALRTFFGSFGVSAKDFDAAWNSFTVQTRMAQAAKLEDTYGIQGVPTIIVNGKWKTGAGYQMPYSEIMNCVDFLIQKERAAMQAQKKAGKKK